MVRKTLQWIWLRFFHKIHSWVIIDQFVTTSISIHGVMVKKMNPETDEPILVTIFECRHCPKKEMKFYQNNCHLLTVVDFELKVVEDE